MTGVGNALTGVDVAGIVAEHDLIVVEYASIVAGHDFIPDDDAFIIVEDTFTADENRVFLAVVSRQWHPLECNALALLAEMRYK